MGHSRSVRRRATVRLVSSALVLLLVAGCASTQIGAQWVDPQYAKQSLQGTAVLVVCEAQDTTLRLLCESKFAARLAALGAKPMSESTQVGAAPAGVAPPSATPGGEANSTALRAAAKEAGARSVLQVSLRPDYSAPNATPSFSFGIGGFGGSRSGVGGGVGVAVPVGAASGAGMAGSSTLVDVASGRVIWSARATAPASSDMSAQVDELAAVSINALQQAGLF